MRKSNRIPLFCIITSLYWFSLYAYVPTLSTYVKSLGASYKMVGLIIGSYGFTQMILRIPLGILSDRINNRKLFIILGIVFAVISGLGLWYFDDVGMVLLFRALSGAAAASWVTFTVLFSSYFEGSEAPKAIGIINSSCSFGQMIAMILGGIAAQYFGPTAPFFLAMSVGIIGLLLSPAAVEQKVAGRKPLKILDLLAVAKDFNLMVFSTLAILSQFIVFATVYGFTPIAAKNIGASSFQLGLLTTLAAFPGIFAAFLSGSFFARRLGERKTIIVGFVITAFTSVLTPYAGHMAILYALQFLGGFGQGTVFPMLMALSIKNVEDGKRATAMGFFQAIYGIGMFLGPVIVGFMSDMAGLVPAFWVIGFISLLGAVLSCINPRIFTANIKQAVSD